MHAAAANALLDQDLPPWPRQAGAPRRMLALARVSPFAACTSAPRTAAAAPLPQSAGPHMVGQ